MPAPSIARAEKECEPSSSDPTEAGLVQGKKLAPSSEHSYVAPPARPKVAVRLRIGPDGPEVMEVSGGTVSTVKLRDGGAVSTLPTESNERTLKVCAPSASVGAVNGDSHGANAPESIAHSKLSPPPSALKLKSGDGSLVGPEGPESMDVVGGIQSASKVTRAASRKVVP